MNASGLPYVSGTITDNRAHLRLTKLTSNGNNFSKTNLSRLFSADIIPKTKKLYGFRSITVTDEPIGFFLYIITRHLRFDADKTLHNIDGNSRTIRRKTCTHTHTHTHTRHSRVPPLHVTRTWALCRGHKRASTKTSHTTASSRSTYALLHAKITVLAATRLAAVVIAGTRIHVRV